MEMGKRMRSTFVLGVLMLVPFTCNAEGYQNIETLREQNPNKVVFDCKDKYGRNIYINSDAKI